MPRTIVYSLLLTFLLNWLSCRGGARTRLDFQTVPSTGLSALLTGQEATPVPGTREDKRLEEATSYVLKSFATTRMHLQIDKSVTRPGEAIWFRVWERNAADLEETSTEHSITVELFDPRGQRVLEKKIVTDGPEDDDQGDARRDRPWDNSWRRRRDRQRDNRADASKQYGFTLPISAPGGPYQVRATSERGATVVRQVLVQTYESPRIRKRVELPRQQYAPGDEVVATVSLHRATGQPLSNTRFGIVVTVDDTDLPALTATTDASGQAIVRFRLPDQIAVGNARLTLSVSDGGVTESMQEPIPIHLGTIRMALYPEGGALVEGLPGRVYFEATDARGEPVDVSGRMVDGNGREIARFQSIHNGDKGHMGRGRLEVVARNRAAYELVVEKPAGVAARYPLPEAQPRGCTMVSADLDDRRPDVRMGVFCTHSRRVTFAAVARDNLLTVKAVAVRAFEPAIIAAKLPPTLQGAVRVTLFDDQLRPMAERLVYRGRGRDLAISLKPSVASTIPGQAVEVEIETRAPDGRPVPAEVSIVAVDRTALDLGEDTRSSLAAALLLEGELPDERLRSPDDYLAGEDGARAVDLLLGTRGWRRFKWQPILDRVARNGPVRYDFEDDDTVNDLISPDGEMIETRSFASHTGSSMPTPVKSKPRGAQFTKTAPASAAPGVVGDTGLASPPLVKPSIAPYTRWEVVREFAAPLPRPSSQRSVRTDFRDTVAFESVQTDDSGRARVTLRVSDAITSFNIRAQGIGAGYIGGVETQLESTLPVSVAAVLPHEVSTGDEIQLPVVLTNNTSGALDVQVRGSFGAAYEVTAPLPGTVSLAAGARSSVTVGLTVKKALSKGVASTIAISAGASTTAGVGSEQAVDTVARAIRIVPRGFPWRLSKSGIVDLSRRAPTVVSLPVGPALPGTLRAAAEFYVAQLASLAAAAAAMIREPHGCFEQTSSSNYPNILALEYLRATGTSNPAIAEKANDALLRGYRRLSGFEVKGGGFSLFGEEPAQETLTAYGLMQFIDMQRVWGGVDPALIERTRTWLRSRRTSDGRYRVARSNGGSFSYAEGPIVDAYITWALAEAGERDLDIELARIKIIARSATDPYILALASNVLTRLEPNADSTIAALDRLVAMQKKNGSFPASEKTIAGGWYRTADIETTALALLAVNRLRARYTTASERALRFLARQRRGGSFGSTQATVLALKAINTSQVQRRGGTLRVSSGGAAVAGLTIDGKKGRFRLDDLERHLKVGNNQLRLQGTGKGEVPYSVAVIWRQEKPQSAGDSPVEVATRLERDALKVGEATRLLATVKNRSEATLPMPMARIGFPGGLSVASFQLDALVKNGTIAFYETHPRELILYFDTFPPGKAVDIVVDAVAQVPGTYTGPPSLSYLYYSDDAKHWAPPLSVRITGR